MDAQDTMTGELSQAVDGMRVEWDTPISLSDGTTLRANVFRPTRQEST